MTFIFICIYISSLAPSYHPKKPSFQSTQNPFHTTDRFLFLSYVCLCNIMKKFCAFNIMQICPMFLHVSTIHLKRLYSFQYSFLKKHNNPFASKYNIYLLYIIIYSLLVSTNYNHISIKLLSIIFFQLFSQNKYLCSIIHISNIISNDLVFYNIHEQTNKKESMFITIIIIIIIIRKGIKEGNIDPRKEEKKS